MRSKRKGGRLSGGRRDNGDYGTTEGKGEEKTGGG